MRSIGKLFTAFATLADSVLSLASVVDAATAKLRQQLALEYDPPQVLDHQPANDAEEAPAVNGTGKGKKARAGV